MWCYLSDSFLFLFILLAKQSQETLGLFKRSKECLWGWKLFIRGVCQPLIDLFFTLPLRLTAFLRVYQEPDHTVSPLSNRLKIHSVHPRTTAPPNNTQEVFIQYWRMCGTGFSLGRIFSCGQNSQRENWKLLLHGLQDPSAQEQSPNSQGMKKQQGQRQLTSHSAQSKNTSAGAHLFIKAAYYLSMLCSVNMKTHWVFFYISIKSWEYDYYN